MATAKTAQPIQLGLSHEEAETLHAILWFTSGSTEGRRGHCDTIRQALEGLLRYDPEDRPIGVQDLTAGTCHIRFEEAVSGS